MPSTKQAMLCISLVITVTFYSSSSYSQSLNTREAAPPKTKAAISRALTDQRSQAAQAGDLTLNHETVNMDCSPVEIGASEADEKDNKVRKTPKAREEPQIVVPGDIINICR